MGVYRKQGAWWIDRYEGRRRLRKKTRAATKTEARTLLEKVRAGMLLLPSWVLGAEDVGGA